MSPQLSLARSGRALRQRELSRFGFAECVGVVAVFVWRTLSFGRSGLARLPAGAERPRFTQFLILVSFQIRLVWCTLPHARSGDASGIGASRRGVLARPAEYVPGC